MFKKGTEKYLKLKGNATLAAQIRIRAHLPIDNFDYSRLRASQIRSIAVNLCSYFCSSLFALLRP